MKETRERGRGAHSNTGNTGNTGNAGNAGNAASKKPATGAIDCARRR